MRNNIIVDIDGVLHQPDIIGSVYKHTGITIAQKDIWNYNISQALGLSEFVATEIWGEVSREPIRPVPRALETLARLRADDYKILIHTHRIKYIGLDELYDWLDDSKVPFDEVLSNPLDFPNYAVAAIDDMPEKLLTTAEVCYVKHLILVNQPWNRQCLDIQHKLTRANKWTDVEKIIKNQLNTY